MSKWEMVRLGDVCAFINGDRGVNYPSAKDFQDLGIPFINAGHLKNESISFENMNYISEEKYNKLGLGKIQDGDLLYCLRGSLGKQAIVEGLNRGAIASSLVILRPHNIKIAFLKYAMKSNAIIEQQERANNGSSQPNLSANSVKNYLIPLPSPHVQQKIADILDRANALIEKRKAQIEKLDLLVKSQFIEMFGDPVTNPKGWGVKRLGELFKVRSSKRVYQHEQTNDGVPFLRISDLTNRIIDDINSCSLYISEELFDEYKKMGYVPKSGDILVTSRGTLGLCYIVQNSDKFYFQDGMISWLSHQRVEVDSHYIRYLFLTDDIKRQIERLTAGSTVGYLSLANLENLKIMFPQYMLQSEFASFVERVEEQKNEFQKSLALMELSYKSLMQKCFEGEI